MQSGLASMKSSHSWRTKFPRLLCPSEACKPDRRITRRNKRICQVQAATTLQKIRMERRLWFHHKPRISKFWKYHDRTLFSNRAPSDLRRSRKMISVQGQASTSWAHQSLRDPKSIAQVPHPQNLKLLSIS